VLLRRFWAVVSMARSGFTRVMRIDPRGVDGAVLGADGDGGAERRVGAARALQKDHRALRGTAKP